MLCKLRIPLCYSYSLQAERWKEDERRQQKKREREDDQRKELERRQQDERRKEEERQEENRKEKLWEAMMERLTTPGTTSSTPHAVKESSSVSDWDKVPKFRKLEVEEDVDAYLGAYEAHMNSYSVPRTQWSKNLALILNPDATVVYMAMESEDQKNYGSLKEALYAHYNVSKETYRRKMEQLRRK